MYYVEAMQIPVGQWIFYPELMKAVNIHNGTTAHFQRIDKGFNIICWSCPANWMLTELSEWFSKWIEGK